MIESIFTTAYGILAIIIILLLAAGAIFVVLFIIGTLLGLWAIIEDKIAEYKKSKQP